MKAVPQAIKEAIVKKVLSQPNPNLKDIAIQYNVSYSGVAKWLKQYRLGTLSTNQGNHSKNTFSRAERFQHVLATAALDKQATGVYCRERGLFSLQLTEWKNEMMLEDNEQKHKDLAAEIKSLRLENKELKQDLHRKNQALAETTALLVLKKKADAILGDAEDD